MIVDKGRLFNGQINLDVGKWTMYATSPSAVCMESNGREAVNDIGPRAVWP